MAYLSLIFAFHCARDIILAKYLTHGLGNLYSIEDVCNKLSLFELIIEVLGTIYTDDFLLI